MMGLNSKSEKRVADVSLFDEGENVERPNKRIKPIDSKGDLNAVIVEEFKTSSGPPSPVPFLSPDGRISKPAEIFRTDLISAMKLPDTQILNPENYMTIIDPWRQEWEKGVQVPVHPEGLSQPSFSVIDTLKAPKKTSNFKLPGKLLNSEEKRKGRKPCNYDLNRMDVEWLFGLNKSRRNKGLVELDEAVLEKAISYFEDKCYENLGYAIATQEGLSIEYDESVCCDVCQSPDSEEGNEMVFCDSCDICVHQACYGIQTIPEGSWLCQPCRKAASKPPCQFCPNSGGAMKRTKKGKNWAHVSCALWVPEVGFGSVEKMEPIVKIENIPASRWNLVCYLCREKVGACIQCTVKTCMTAFHVTCGFKNGLEMKTVLDDTAVDGVRHLCYCAKHGYKNKSPPRTPEKCKKDAEDAENQRQKRLKQMETEFYTFVDVCEAAKDLCVPKELASRIHAYWTLKRKARDDIPLLPPTLEQQEKLCGKQGAASRILQVQIEELMKMRCDLERLRNLCYMVSKREKLRRELYRVREQVFWKAHEVMVDETICVDDTDLQWIREACGKNFSCDGSEPSTKSSFDYGTEPVSSSCTSSSTGGKTASEELRGEQTQSIEPSDCSEDDVRGGYESSDSEDSPRIKTRRRLRGFSSRKPQNDVVSRIKSGSKENQQSSNVNTSSGANDATARVQEESEDCESIEEAVNTPRRSLRFYKTNGSQPLKEEHEQTHQTPETTKLKRIAGENGKKQSDIIGLQRPRTRGQTSESDQMELESFRADDSPSRMLRSCRKSHAEQHSTSRKRRLSTESKSMTDHIDSTPPGLVRETRRTRLRQSSLSQSEDEVKLEAKGQSLVLSNCTTTTLRAYDKETINENKVLKENNVRSRTRNSTTEPSEEPSNNILPNKRRRSEVKRHSKGRTSITPLIDNSDVQAKITEFFFKSCPKQNRRVPESPKNKTHNGYKSPRVTRSTESENSKSDEENAGGRPQGLSKSPTAKFHNGHKNPKVTKCTEIENSKSDEENSEGRAQRLSSLRSFTTGKDNLPPSPCPKCQIQHNQRRNLSRSPERRNKELRPRNMQSPKSRSRLLSSLRCSPTRSYTVLSQVRHTSSVV